MADTKISQLTATTTPGSADLLEIVQAGTNKKITYSNLTSGLGGGAGQTNVADLVADYGAVPTGGTVTTGAGAGALNVAIGDINSNAIDALFIPPGNYVLSVVPDVLTTSDFAIFGAGPGSKLTFASTAAHGTFFKLGVSGGARADRFTISDLQLTCGTVNIPPNTENAFHLVKGGTGLIYNILANNIGGLCKMGTGADVLDRFQLYSFQNVRGTWNKATSSPDRIHITNATDGQYSNIRLTQTEVNGGTGILADPISVGVDQHIFHNCEVWSMGSHSENIAAGTTYDGIDWNVEMDFTNGQLVNWMFSNCVFDEGRNGAIFIHSTGGASVCKQIQFVNCHCETNAGNGLKLVNASSQEAVDIGMIGGRIRHKDAAAVTLNGANIFSFFCNGTDFLQEGVVAQGSNATRHSITHTFKHGRAVDDQLVFTGTLPTGLTAGTAYYVKNADANSDGFEFTLGTVTPASGSGVVNISGASTPAAYRVVVPAHVTVDAAQGVRLTGCYGGMFEGGTNTQVNRFVTGAGSGEDHYAIVGNVAPALQTGFTNLSTGASKVVANNAT